MIDHYKGVYPEIHDSVFVAKNAVINGDVKIDRDSSIWFHVVIRGDVAPTIIGKGVSIQDLTVLHQSPNTPLIIEDGVTVGHQVTLHSATIRKNALIGMGAIILDGAEVGENAFVAAGSVLPPRKKVPANTLYMGNPARYVRDLTEADYAEMERVRNSYIEKGLYYKNETNLGK